MTARGNILVADDDAAIRTVLNQALSRVGHEVRVTSNASTLWRWVAAGEGDLVITDVVMPDENAFDMLPRIKKARPELPVIVMSAQNTFMTAIRASETGAYEYLPKPFDPRELILRINNILRRGGPVATPKVEQLVFGPYTFQIARRELKRGGEALKLTDREQEILAIFAARAGETIPRHELVGDESDVGERTIDVQINRLRRKIERDPSNPVWLQTVRGIGYRLSVE
ncbi:MAG: response regulator transcription factor [Mesorhizobium sp.]|nr:MAG: response regulator transcription factor [Mesorhizobium sp.]